MIEAGDTHVAVISSGRPGNVVGMTLSMRGLPTATWYVPEGQGDAYRAFGAERVRELPGELVDARNAALEDAFAGDRGCLQLDDDFERLVVMESPEDTHPKQATLAQGAAILRQELLRSNAQLAGASSTGNAYFVRRDVSRAHFIIASFMYVAPSPPRFDRRFALKEDYDFTCQHLAMYGEVCRVDRLLPNFRHYTNRGGCQVYRDKQAEDRACELLMEKWPGVFHLNPRRPGEVLMRWPAKAGRERT